MALPRIGLTFRADPLLWVQDIEAFDGPILSEYRDADGSVYLEKWCAHDAATRTTRVLRVTSRHRAIAEYLGGRCSMRELLTRPNHNAGMLVDADSTGIVGAALVDVAALPPEYLPDVDAMHDESLRPTTGTVREMFLLDAEWDGSTIARLERRFIDVAAFAYCTAPSRPSGTPQYKFESGWAYGNAFTAMRARMPRAERPRAAAVEAASPGVLGIDAPAATSGAVLNALRRARSNDAVTAYDTLHEWSRLKYERAELVPEARAERDLRALSAILDVAVEAVWQPDNDVGPQRSLLTAGKLVAAYYRRIWDVLLPQGAEFVRPEFSTAPPRPPDSLSYVDDDDDDLRW